MTKRNSPEHLEMISFKNLVKAIDAKWGHTYQPIEPVETSIEELLEEIKGMKSD